MATYSQKLRHPKWQKRRLEVMKKAEWKCQMCGEDDKELHVHHIEYNKGKEPWEYPNENFLVVCQPCHEERIHKEGSLYKGVPKVASYRVIKYEHVDDFRCFHPLNTFVEEFYLYGNPSKEFVELLTSELRRRLSELFISAGWEGDGDIECVHIPPFMNGRGFTNCQTIFHVKQMNNGTSFIATPHDIDIRLDEGY